MSEWDFVPSQKCDSDNLAMEEQDCAVPNAIPKPFIDVVNILAGTNLTGKSSGT